LLGDGYRPKNENTICLYQSNNNPSDYGFWQADRIPVDPGKLYEFSVGGANSRCSLTIYLRFRYGDGSISKDFTATKDAFSEGNTLANFPTMWVRGQPPAGTQWVECLILKNGTRAGYNDSYAWFVRPQLREVYASAPAPATYAPGRPGAALATMSASITQNGTAIATANSSLASLQTIVQSGNPNLLRNGGFAQGMNYWAQTAAGWGTFQSPWGKIATRGDWSGEYSYIESERAPVYGGQVYTLSADSMYYLNSGSGHCYTELVWYDGAGNYITQHSGTAHAATHDYSNTSSNRNIHRLSIGAPGNAATVVSRLVHYKVNGSVASNAGWRQVKLEQGNVMTAFSNEASVTTISETVTSVDGKANTALARAAVRLDVNGYVVGWEANNNGSYGNMVINTNNFAIKNPNGGARTEYENGCWKVFDANGQLRVRLGNLSA
jgi:hypothetical protein